MPHLTSIISTSRGKPPLLAVASCSLPLDGRPAFSQRRGCCGCAGKTWCRDFLSDSIQENGSSMVVGVKGVLG